MIRSSWKRRWCLLSLFANRTPYSLRSAASLSASADKRLLGKVAVITGGANGIGDTTTRLFVSHGARVVVADVQDDTGYKLEQELQAKYSPTSVRYVHCDVRKESDVSRAIDVAHSLEGHVDILFSNAGILGALGPLDQTDVRELDITIEVNLRGHFLAIKHAARVMKPLCKGSIILTGSVAGLVGGLGPHGYAMCKAGVIGLVKSAAVELRQFGVRVNMVSPDALPTRFLSTALETVGDQPVALEKVKQTVKENALLKGRPLADTDIANAALFLAGEESGYISGHNLVVDGGNTVTKPANMHNWFVKYSPMLREGGKRGLE